MTSTTKNAPQVWFITGCSSGLGLLLAHAALSRGDKVIATARKPDSLATLAQNDRCRTLALDVTATQSHLDAKISQAVAEFGRIDVLVNNAGYVLSGVWECVESVAWVGLPTVPH
jgi:NADP-dependent 3-hydroxy acid dehydrogenase YdfG